MSSPELALALKGELVIFIRADGTVGEVGRPKEGGHRLPLSRPTHPRRESVPTAPAPYFTTEGAYTPMTTRTNTAAKGDHMTAEPLSERIERLLDEFCDVGIQSTSLELHLGWSLIKALEDWMPAGKHEGRRLDDLLFNEWKPEQSDFAHFMQELLAEAYRDNPEVPVRNLLTQALLIQGAVRCDPPERVIALFVHEAGFRVRHDDEDDDFGDPAEALRWADEWRRMFATTGWCPSEVPDPKGWHERDFTADRCRACGKFRREGVVVDTRYGEAEERLDDPCIRDLPGVHGACCGHGRSGRFVYVDGASSGPAAARRMRELGGNPPAAAFLEETPADPSSTAQIDAAGEAAGRGSTQ
jgi:hypothetical protein